MTRSRRLEIGGVTVFALLVIVIGLNQWMVFQQLQSRMFGGVDETLAGEFVRVTTTHLALGAGGLLVGCAAIAVVLTALGVTCSARNLFAIMLLASGPMLVYELGICLALLNGWQADAWVMSAAGSSARDVAATLLEAIPVVLEPPPVARYGAIAGSAIMAGVLHGRFCVNDIWRSLTVSTSVLAVAIVVGM